MVKIFIDPGHGGSDSGAVANGMQEKDIVLQISKRIEQHLKKYRAVHVKLSRTTDVFIPLARRTNNANRWGADYFVSIHINSGGGTGFESYIYTGVADSSKTNKLRNTIHQEVVKVNGLKDRGKKKANFHVVRESKMPAMLGENGFIDSKSDVQKMKDKQWIDKVGKAYATGIAKAFNLKKDASATEPTTETPEVEPQFTGKIAGLQHALNEVYGFSLSLDNIYGSKTKQAMIKAYQRELNKQFKAGLAVDGIWGPATSKATVNVKKGAKGQLTWILQALLILKGYTINVDGLFGEATEKAVKSYQRAQKLHVDGVAGKATYQALF